MAKLADALDLGSSGATLAGSTPVTRTSDVSIRTFSNIDIKHYPLGHFDTFVKISRGLIILSKQNNFD